jgi:DNA-binding NarL/FixJ family response regulator
MSLLDELRRLVPFDAHVWLLTDPETEVGSSPLADIPAIDDLPRFIRAKYLTVRNRWTSMRVDEAVGAAGSTDGVSTSAILSAASTVGVEDIGSTVFRDSFGCWGFLDLWRVGGVFADDELAVLAELASAATGALRRCVATTFTAATDARQMRDRQGPAVLLLSDDLRLLTRTAQADADLRAVLPTERERAPVPASAMNVAAQLLAVEAGVDHHAPAARVHLGGGEWCTFAAARLDDPTDPGAIAVSIERTPPQQRAGLYGRAIGLRDREAQLLRELVRGGDTRAIAARLHLSPHTVQDHLKSIFAKSGVRSRPALVARATGNADLP